MKGLLSNAILAKSTLFGSNIDLNMVKAGDSLWVKPNTTKVISGSVYTKAQEIKLGASGSIRVLFGIRPYDNNTKVYGRVYINGIPVGIERVHNNCSYPLEFAEDFLVKKGDLIQIYTKADSSPTWLTKFEIRISIPLPYTDITLE